MVFNVLRFVAIAVGLIIIGKMVKRVFSKQRRDVVYANVSPRIRRAVVRLEVGQVVAVAGLVLSAIVFILCGDVFPIHFDKYAMGAMFAMGGACVLLELVKGVMDVANEVRHGPYASTEPAPTDIVREQPDDQR